ncbi:hypothetical protein P389DRAFT_109018 [Cystobasidium minutum MCA 4210]|uniref:uncharacterized protein n=1 Tax=Cystobasidium minutum MCA 4210 TaxID=1397322 RepID=UPI0034CDCA3E|eukprot:jgi/Rhomi1/109018/CE109017_51
MKAQSLLKLGTVCTAVVGTSKCRAYCDTGRRSLFTSADQMRRISFGAIAVNFTEHPPSTVRSLLRHRYRIV